MVLSRFTNIKTIPSKVTTGKTSPNTTNFADGIATYQPNDTMKTSQVRLAQDARFDRIGEYKTRRGYKKLSDPIGYQDLSANLAQQDTDTPLAEVEPYTFTPASDAIAYSIVIRIKNTTGSTKYAVPCLSLWSGDEKIAETFIDPATITDEFQILEAVFMNTPNVYENETISVKIGTQNNNPSDYIVSTVAGPTLGCGVKTCTEGRVDNVFEANIDGTRTILFTQNEKLYRMAANGTITKIRDLPQGVTKVRFNQNLNKIRYVDGKESPRLIDPSNSWSDTAITTTVLETGTDLQIKTSNIMDGVNSNLVYFNAEVDTQIVWTYTYGITYTKPYIYSTTVNLSQTMDATTTVAISTLTALTSKAPANAEVGDYLYHASTIGVITAINGSNLTVKTTTNETVYDSYDMFDRDFNHAFPAIQTGDPITAMFVLGGVYYILTRRNKYQMYSQTEDQWSSARCTAQNGTFSQESVVCDLNYAYFANDTGIYRFNGVDEDSLTQTSIQNVYDAIPNKDNIVLDLYQNRLYVYYSSTSGGVNDHCLVYNINLGKWESFDSNTYVSATSARQNSSNRFLCGHSRIGLIMVNEDETNNYNDLGQAIAFNLETSYQHYGTTSQLKRIPKWRPEFATTTKPYSVQCGYALDYTDNVQYAFSVNLQNLNTVNENYVWDEPSNYGVPTMPTVLSTIPQINGEFYRVQLRYQHIAAFEPVTFRSHTVTVQTQRIR